MKKKARKTKAKYAPPEIKKLNDIKSASALRFRMAPPGIPGPVMKSPSVPGRVIF